MPDSCAPASRAHPQIEARPVENVCELCTFARLNVQGALWPTVAPKDQGHGLDAGMQSQLAQEALHVAADGPGADPQNVRDPRGGVPVGHRLEDLALAGREQGKPAE